MKKVIKRVIPFVLVVVMCLCMAAPAFAASDAWVSKMKTFEGRWWGGTNDEYVNMIQSAMWAYGGSSRTYISDNGGTDGTYGEGTYNAVMDFQKAEGIGADGSVGTETWGKIASLSTVYQSGYTYYLRMPSGYYYGYAYCSSGSPTANTSSWYYYNRARSVTGYSYAFAK